MASESNAKKVTPKRDLPIRSVVVIGAGIIGVTTAYELAKQGHNVTVLDKYSTAAQFCSFSPAGVGRKNPGYKSYTQKICEPKSHGMLDMIASMTPWFKLEHRSVGFMDPYFLTESHGWKWGFYYVKRSVDSWMAPHYYNIRQSFCNAMAFIDDNLPSADLKSTFHSRTAVADTPNPKPFKSLRAMRQHFESYCWNATQTVIHSELADVFTKAGVHFNSGYSQVFGNPTYDHMTAHSGRDANEVEKEGLKSRAHNKMQHFVHIEGDTSVTTNARKLTIALLDKTREMGVDYRFNTEVKKILVSDGSVYGVYCGDSEIIAADNIVVCGGVLSSHLLNRKIYNYGGGRVHNTPFLPISPLQGFTIQVDVDKFDYPHACNVFFPFHLYATHVGDNRVHLANYGYMRPMRTAIHRWRNSTPATMHRSEDRYENQILAHFERNIEKHILHLFGITKNQWNQRFRWTGFRPATPDFLPIISAVDTIDGLFINAGHESHGVRNSFGSAKLISKLITESIATQTNRFDLQNKYQLRNSEFDFKQLLSLRRFRPSLYLMTQ